MQKIKKYLPGEGRGTNAKRWWKVLAPKGAYNVIRYLIHQEKHVYILFENEDIAKRFLSDAESEGITFSDGSKPTDKAPDDIIALLPNGTICYVGFIGRMCRHSNQCICVDYEEYIR